MTNATQTHTTYWVCVDCYSEQEGVLEEYDGDRDALLSLIPDTAEVTSGMVWEEHADDCDGAIEAALGGGFMDATECGCERREFSWSRCDGCGSTLGGAREALTVWE